MADTLTYKILRKHLVSGELVSGAEIGIRIDQTLTQDATGTMAYLQFEAMGIKRARTELSISYVDHNTLQDGFENADDHRYLQSVAAKHGILFSRPGNGICHQVHLERFARPGRTLLGSDSHTPTCGGAGMFAVGAGGLDVAVAMGGGPFYLVAPKVVKVELIGKLEDWVTAKDVILHILGLVSTKGNVNRVLEYCGEGLRNLPVPARATIANMGAETGVTTSVFPSDEITRQFLSAQARVSDWEELKADDDAKYDDEIIVNLSRIVPLAAAPHSPGNIVKIRDIAGLKVNQVAIGSCTNSSLRDLMTVGKILSGKKVHPDVSLVVAPGSKQVFSMIARNGTLAEIIDAGARIMEAACGFCIGNGQAPVTGAVSVRTGNRNFEGRSGTVSAKVYLISPEAAALCALKGEIADPSSEGSAYPQVILPDKFDIDDSMVLKPAADPGAVNIIRGPNIGEPPSSDPLASELKGPVLIKLGDKITTDHIMPAGSRLKYRSNIKKYAEFVFEAIDPDFARNALAAKGRKKAVFILAGASYGQGSSREHAAICPMYLGVRAIFAKSFERIHSANLVNFGILPLVFVNEADYEKIDKDDEMEIGGILERIERNEHAVIFNKTKDTKINMAYFLTDRQKKILKAGGLLNYTKQQSI